MPNTYAAAAASLRTGWGGQEPDALVQPWVVGETEFCDCGTIKRVVAEACFKCLTLDAIPVGTQGLILEALEHGDGMTIKELAAACRRTDRVIWRNVKPLVEARRVRSWMEDRDPYDLTPEDIARRRGPAARFTTQVLPPQRVFRRAW